jgi:hypothetical protein
LQDAIFFKDRSQEGLSPNSYAFQVKIIAHNLLNNMKKLYSIMQCIFFIVGSVDDGLDGGNCSLMASRLAWGQDWLQ